MARGIGLVHQELCVIPDASVAENILVDALVTGRFGLIDWPATNAAALKHMQSVGLDVAPDRLVRGLSAAQKQLIQIARALSLDVRVLLLDEPTSSLTEHEARRLFSLLAELKSRGVAIIFISHKLDEVSSICDRITILRDGKHVKTAETKELSTSAMAALMIGRECREEHLGRVCPDFNKVVLSCKNVTREGKANNISFDLHQGEVLGFYGLVGSGRTELARILIGEDIADSGSVFLHGKHSTNRNVGKCLSEYGLGYITENRKEEGLFLDDSVMRNLTVCIWPKLLNQFTRAINPLAEAKYAQGWVEAMEIKTPSLDRRVGNLSGGNQQKVSIGKWLAAECRILIVDEPTVGVDIGAKRQIHQLIWNLAVKEGRSVIVISSDLAELSILTNRILIFRSNQIVGEVRDIDSKGKSYDQISREIAPFFH
jgi:ribose transport system ATP-binding protein